MRKQGERGLTMIELIVAFTILALLSTMAVPLARYKVRRDKERDLRIALREMRTAIDKYKDASDQGKIQVKLGTEGYPEDLDVLVEGVTMSGSTTGAKIKFLRRIPIDPMTNSTEWGKRSLQDDPDSQSWGGQDVFDVYTKSTERDRGGTPYSEY
jgi:general secretion pathway protein G